MDLHVGARVRLRRRICNLTQEELAERAQVSAQMIQKYEQGETRLSASRLADLARILNVSPGWFFEECAAVPEPSAFPEVISAEAAELVALMSEVDQTHIRKKIVAIVRLLVRDKDDDRRVP